MFSDAIRRTAVTSRDRTIEDTPVATCTISPAATNAISFEKSARVAHELTLVRRAQRGDEEAFATLFQLKGCRKIFGLHEVDGYQHREIAELLHCSIGNSKSQFRKAKLKMRDLLFPDWSSTPLRSAVRMTDESRGNQDSESSRQ